MEQVGYESMNTDWESPLGPSSGYAYAFTHWKMNSPQPLYSGVYKLWLSLHCPRLRNDHWGEKLYDKGQG